MKKLSGGCTLDCFDACKFNVYVDNGKVVKIEGDKNHPYTKGFVCKKGLMHLDRMNHKDRSLHIGCRFGSVPCRCRDRSY